MEKVSLSVDERISNDASAVHLPFFVDIKRPNYHANDFPFSIKQCTASNKY